MDEPNGIAAIDVDGTTKHVSVQLLEDDEAVGVGDWVLVHLGFAMGRLDEDEARETLGFLEGLSGPGPSPTS